MARRTSSRLREWSTLVVWMAGFLWSASVSAADPTELVEHRVVILVKALSYDEKLVERAGREMVVAVGYSGAERGAEEEAEAWRKAFAGLTTLRFLGLPFRVTKLPIDTPEHLRSTIKQEGIDALFVAGEMKDELAWIQRVTRESKVLTLASRQPQVTAGLSLGVFSDSGGKSTLLINSTAARAEGAQFNSVIFTLAKVIR